MRMKHKILITGKQNDLMLVKYHVELKILVIIIYR